MAAEPQPATPPPLAAAPELLASIAAEDPDSWALCDQIYPHLLGLPDEAEAPGVRELTIRVVECLHFRGAYDRARDLGRRAYHVWTERHGQTDESALLLSRTLWFALIRSGRRPEAAELTQQVLAAAMELGDDRLQDRLYPLGQTAIHRAAEGNLPVYLAAAEAVFEQAVQTFGANDPRAWDHIHNYGVALRACGRYSRALALDEASLARSRTRVGDGHPDTLLALMAVGLDRRELGEYVTAVDLLEQVVAATGRFGPATPITARATARLAVARRRLGDARAAVEMATRVHAVQADQYGETDRDTLVTALNLSVALRHTGNLDAAATLAQATWSRCVRAFGPSHPDTLAAQGALAVTVRQLGDASRAHMLNQGVIDQGQATLGPRHPIVWVAAANLSTDLLTQGDAADALEADQLALKQATACLGPAHPTVHLLEVNTAITLRALGRESESHDLHQHALAQLHARLPTDHPAGRAAAAWQRADFDHDPMPR